MSPKVLLTATTRWPSAALLAGAFARAGARVDAFCLDDAVMALSRHVAKRHRYDVLAPQRSLQSAVEQAAPDLIVPCDDRAVAQLVRFCGVGASEFVRQRIVHSLGNPASYPNLISRNVFMGEVQALGIPGPASSEVRDEADIDALIDRLGLPLVFKQDASWGGQGVMVARARQDALLAFRSLSRPSPRWKGVLRAMLRKDAHFLRDALYPSQYFVSAQAYVHGTPATSALACWKGKLLSAIHADVVVAAGASGPACVLKRVADRQMQTAAERIVQRFGLSGLHGLDFIRDETGAVHLIELNPRATQLSPHALGPDCDLPAALLSAATGASVAARASDAANPLIALFPQEWRRDPASPYLTAAFHAVPWDDPAVVGACLKPLRRGRSRSVLQSSAGMPMRAFTTWKPSRPSV